MPSKLIFQLTHVVIFKISHRNEFAFGLYILSGYCHAWHGDPASLKTYNCSTHVMHNAWTNCSQDSPTPPLQTCRIILLIYFRPMSITEHGWVVKRGNKPWQAFTARLKTFLLSRPHNRINMTLSQRNKQTIHLKFNCNLDMCWLIF